MSAADEDDIIEVVDEIADDIDALRILGEAKRLGITLDELLSRVVNEVQMRVAP